MDFPFNPTGLDLLRIDVLNTMALFAVLFACLLLVAIVLAMCMSVATAWGLFFLQQITWRMRWFGWWRWCVYQRNVLSWGMDGSFGGWIWRVLP